MEGRQTMRIVFLGKTGAGKSSLANTIFGEDVFNESSSANSETKICQAKNTKINGKDVLLIDTPGLFDTDLNSTKLSPEILKCIKECAPGLHAVLIVLKVERYTKHEQEVVDEILKYFSKEALKYTTVIFTHGDQLSDELRIEDWVNENKSLRKLVDKCGGRCHVFDNKYWNNSQDQYRNNQVQVKELLETIDKTVTENGGGFYTNTFLEKIIENIKRFCSHFKDIPAKDLVKALLGVGVTALIGKCSCNLSFGVTNITNYQQNLQGSIMVSSPLVVNPQSLIKQRPSCITKVIGGPDVCELQESLKKRTTCSTETSTAAHGLDVLDLQSTLRKIAICSSEDTLRIVLLGKDGSGKSSLGNTIFGYRKNVFKVNHTSNPSNHCQSETKSVNGKNIQLIDTPGFSQQTTAALGSDMLKSITEFIPRFHAFLLVLKVQRFSKHEKAVVDLILKYFSEDALKYTTVVFTYGDNLPKGIRMQEWVGDNEALNDLVNKCGGRCHVFDNKYWNNSQDHYRNNQVQVKELLETIDNTMRECYSKNTEQNKPPLPKVPPKPPKRDQKCT